MLVISAERDRRGERLWLLSASLTLGPVRPGVKVESDREWCPPLASAHPQVCRHVCTYHTHTKIFFLILWILKTGNLPRDSTTQSRLDPPTSFSKKMLHRHAHCMMAAVLQLRFPLPWCHLGSLCLGWSYPPLTHHCVDFSLVLKGILTRHIPPSDWHIFILQT